MVEHTFHSVKHEQALDMHLFELYTSMNYLFYPPKHEFPVKSAKETFPYQIGYYNQTTNHFPHSFIVIYTHIYPISCGFAIVL